jgi:hypothetical protein
MSSDFARMLSQLEHAGFTTLPLLAVSRSPGRSARPGTLYLTPGCDVAAILEGRA